MFLIIYLVMALLFMLWCYEYCKEKHAGKSWLFVFCLCLAAGLLWPLKVLYSLIFH